MHSGKEPIEPAGSHLGSERLPPGWKALIPLVFVVLSLIALALVPLLVDRRIRPLRNEVADVIEPSRVLVARLEGLLAREVSLLRGYLLTGDQQMLLDYRDVVAQERAIYDQLSPVVERLGPEAQRSLFELRAEARAWQEASRNLNPGASPEQIARELPQRQDRFEEIINIAGRLERALYEEERSRRQQIFSLLGLSRWLTLGLVLLAGISVGIVTALGVRLGRRTRTERALRQVSSTLTGALDVEQIMRLIASQAHQLTRARGVYVERIAESGDTVEVISAAGDWTPRPGTRVPYPGSLTEEMLRRREPQLLPDVGSIGSSMAPYLAESCNDCSALVVPLVADDKLILGALVLLKRPPHFSKADATLASTLGDLASIASRKVLLLTEAERRRAEIEELAETKAKLLRGISHDLKNPIGALDGYAALLEIGIKGELNPEQLQYVQRIRRAGNSLLDIIEGLLDLARADSGQIPIERRPTDVAQVAREAAEDYRASINVAGLELCVELPPELPTVETDAKRVRAILGNLLSNAIKYTPAGSRVTVRAGVRSGGRAPGRGNWVAIDVVDTGRGIAVEDQERIFEEFERLEPDQARGAGIGLSISRRIARLLGGDITVRSAPGEGATFSVWLSCIPDEAAGDQSTGKRASSP